MELGIKGKTALVCGASKGLGRSIALSLAQEGVSLVLLARSQASLESLKTEALAAGATAASTFACDLTDSSNRKDVCQQILHQIKHVDILIHNTGGPPTSTVEDTAEEAWNNAFQRLFQSVTVLNQHFVPSMKANKWGRIIVITSLSVIEPIASLAQSNAMRSAVTAMSKTLSDELAPHNITVNCVAPGWILTDRTQDLLEQRIAASKQDPLEYMENHTKSIPMLRLGTPEELASVVTFLASDKASYVTGSTICVDGGKRRSTY